MSKPRSISDLVTELQKENDSLQYLRKLFNQAVKIEFKYDTRQLHEVIRKWELHEKRLTEKQAQQQHPQPQQQGQTEQHF